MQWITMVVAHKIVFQQLYINYLYVNVEKFKFKSKPFLKYFYEGILPKSASTLVNLKSKIPFNCFSTKSELAISPKNQKGIL